MPPYSRRSVLQRSALCVIGGSSGCLGRYRSSIERFGSTDQRTGKAGWRQFQKDAPNSGSSSALRSDRRYDSVRWEAKLDDGPTGYGGVANPIVSGDLLYVGVFRNEEYRMTARRTEDGTEEWSRPLLGRNSTPAISDGAVFVPTTNVVETNRVSAFDATDGTELWQFDFGGGAVTAATATDGAVYVAHEEPVDGTHSARVFSLTVDGSERWRTQVEGSIEAPVATDGETVFVGTTDGTLHALDAGSGGTKWQTRTDGEIRCAPSVSDDSVYVADETGTVLSISTSGTEQWRAPASSPAPGAGLAVTADSVYVGGENGLHAVRQGDGSERWSVAEDSRATTPAVGGGTVYFGTEDALIAVGTESGERQWSRKISTVTVDDTVVQGVLSAPAIAEDGFYVGTAPGLYAFTADE